MINRSLGGALYFQASSNRNLYSKVEDPHVESSDHQNRFRSFFNVNEDIL